MFTKFLLIFTLVIAPFFVSAQDKSGKMEQDILTLVNKHRQKIGLKALTDNALIQKEALQHSKNMANNSVEFGHDGFKGRSSRLRSKLKNDVASGENVAYGPSTAEAVVDMWLHSPGHKKNIEGDFNLSGIGVAKSSSGTRYYTHFFVKTQ